MLNQSEHRLIAAQSRLEGPRREEMIEPEAVAAMLRLKEVGEPPRDCRRQFRLSHAASAGVSNMA